MSFADSEHVNDGAKTDYEPFALVHDESGSNENEQAIMRLIYWYIGISPMLIPPPSLSVTRLTRLN